MAVVYGGNGKLPEVYSHVTVYDDAGTITLYAGTITGKCKYCDWKYKRRGGFLLSNNFALFWDSGLGQCSIFGFSNNCGQISVLSVVQLSSCY